MNDYTFHARRTLPFAVTGSTRAIYKLELAQKQNGIVIYHESMFAARTIEYLGLTQENEACIKTGRYLNSIASDLFKPELVFDRKGLMQVSKGMVTPQHQLDAEKYQKYIGDDIKILSIDESCMEIEYNSRSPIRPPVTFYDKKTEGPLSKIEKIEYDVLFLPGSGICIEKDGHTQVMSFSLTPNALEAYVTLDWKYPLRRIAVITEDMNPFAKISGTRFTRPLELKKPINVGIARDYGFGEFYVTKIHNQGVTIEDKV
ncbi:MAG: hypothetical protein NDI94_00955 [Candidatus Woesearchaeota archaeon]|nr:hypothetical protein [Candidatus Woesearchaeota archaeon]